MGWMESIKEAIAFMEDNLTRNITIEDIAKKACISPFYFQRGFAMLCGFTVGEYLRKRRLSCAGDDLMHTKQKIIDIALIYGYDSPDSFTKAFTRFHGVTPSMVRKDGAMIKSFAPLKINFILKGGYTMDYKIVEKDAFTVLGVSKVMKYEEAMTQVPKFWQSFFETGKGDLINSQYGINMDENMDGESFEYMIADDYDTSKNVLDGFITKVIPKHTWAIFACKGSSRKLQEINQQIFSEWLPNSKDYEIAEGYNIEYYSDASSLPNGTNDENYYCEVWIPVKKK